MQLVVSDMLIIARRFKHPELENPLPYNDSFLIGRKTQRMSRFDIFRSTPIRVSHC